MAKKTKTKKSTKKTAKKDTPTEQPKTSSKKKYQAVRGMHDILPEMMPYWRKVRKAFEDVSDFYRFGEIATPLVEAAPLFIKGVGEDTDIVEKEMYYLKAKSSGDPLVLRPENTASIVRAYIEHGMNKNVQHPVRLSYLGPFFRHERPQKGRYRQFHQAGFEIISTECDPIYDAIAIIASHRLLEKLKLSNIALRINSIGTIECRKNYLKKLRAYFKSNAKKLNPDQRKKGESNPLRLLDSKDENIQPVLKGAPVILDCLSDGAKKHFTKVLELLDELEISYILDHTLVRGLDYYTDTVFEFVLQEEAKEGEEPFTLSLGGGGRYDPLFKMLGMRTEVSGVGAALGIERVILALESQHKIKKQELKNPVFFVHVGELAKKKSLRIIEDLKHEKINIMETLGKGSLSAQLKAADKIKAPIALIFGQKEAFEDAIILRDMASGAQETVPLKKIVKVLKKRIAENG